MNKNQERLSELNVLAERLYQQGKYAEALPNMQEYNQLIKETFGENHPNYAPSLNNLALLYQYIGMYDKAEPLFTQALQITKTALGENHPEYATNLNNLALLYKSIGAYDKAEPLLSQALQITKELLGENHLDYAQNLNNLAILYQSMGAYDKVEPHLTRALQITKTALGENHPEYARTLNNLAMLYQSMGAYDKAEQLFTQVMLITKEVLGENHPDYAAVLKNLALLYLYIGAYDKVEPLLSQALQIRKNVLGENHPEYADYLDNMAVLYIASNRINDGFTLMKEVSNINNQMIGQIFSIGSEDQRLTYLLMVRPNVDKFISLVFQHFLHCPTAVQDAFALVLKRKAITAEALSAQRDAILGGRYPQLREKLHILNTLGMQITRKVLAGVGKEGSEVYHQYLAEWNKEKEQLEKDLARQIPEIRLEQKFRNADRRTIAYTLPSDSVFLEFFRFDVCDFTAVPARGDRIWNSARYCVFVLHSGDPDNISLIDLGEAEKIDQYITLYKSRLTGEGRGLSESAPQIHMKNLHHEVFSQSRTMQNQEKQEGLPRDVEVIETKSQTGMGEKEGLHLYSALIEPLQDAIRDCSHLIIAPDSQISIIPFEVIPVPEGGYLIDWYHMSYVGVGRDVLRFTADIPGEPTSPMIIASPDFNLRANKNLKQSAEPHVIGRRSRDFSRASLRFTPLPGTKKEGERIGNLLGIQPLMEKDALESRLKSISSPSILHIATHGFFLPDQEISDKDMERRRGVLSGPSNQPRSGIGIENPVVRSGLALAGANTSQEKGELPPEAEDGILTVEDVTGLDLTNTDLTVLSACETGLGEVKNGEGVFGLRRAFTLAGAKTLVMSLWKVPDTATQELMEDFYKRLLKGTPKAEALREAQLELRKRYPHPYDWGAFICQGDPGPMLGFQ